MITTTTSLKLSSILSGLSYALDLTEGHPRGHASRSCLIGMRMAAVLGLSPDDRSHLFYALLLKDAGCSSNSARVFQLFGGDDQKAKRDTENPDKPISHLDCLHSKTPAAAAKKHHILAAAGHPDGQFVTAGATNNVLCGARSS